MTTPWLSGLHPDWETRRPQTLFIERREASRTDDVHLTPSQHHGVLAQVEYMQLTGSKVVLNLTGADNMKHVEADDFIIHLRSFQGGIEHSRFRGKVSNAYTVLTPLDGAVDPRYFRWVMKSPGFIQELQATTNQLRDGQSIGFAEFRTLTLPLPPLAEQVRIARFLDDQTARIDQIVAARQQQIALVYEALQARLTAAVVDLEGTHPVTRLGRFFDYVEQGGSPNGDDREPDNDEPSVLKTSAIKQGLFVEAQRKALVDAIDFDPRYQVRDGDVLVVRGSGSADLVADAAEVRLSSPQRKLMLSDLTYRLAGLALLPSYAVTLLLSPPIRSQIRASVRQGSGPAKVRGEDLSSLVIPVLEPREQLYFSESYWKDRADCDVTQMRLAESVSLLQEFKRSLIAAAVSGEFDVSSASGRGVPA